MGQFSATAFDVATGAVADTFKTLLALKLANTAGHRAELRSLTIAGAGAAAQDVQVGVRINRTNNAGDGTLTSLVPAKKDSASLASIVTAGKNATVEPTTYETQPLWEGGLNSRGSLVISWPKGGGIKWGINQALGILATPGEASAVQLVVTVEWDECE